MGDLRCLVADAHVWAFSIVEQYDALHLFLAFPNRRYLHLVEPLGLDDAVGALGYGILKRVSALCHAYHHAMLLQLRHIRRATVLATPVRVVYQPGSGLVVDCAQGHPQRLQRVSCLQCRPDGPAHNLVGIGIRDQREVAHALLRLHIGDVAHPNLIGAHGNHLLDQVLIFVVMVAGVGCLVVPTPLYLHHQAIGTQELDECVAAWHAACGLEQVLDDDVQLGTAQAGVVTAVVPGLLDYQRLYGIFRKVIAVLMGVERLPAVTKQPAESPQR